MSTLFTLLKAVDGVKSIETEQRSVHVIDSIA